MKIDWSKSLEIIGEEAQLKAVRSNGLAISYIHNPSEQVQLEAVRQYGIAISYIHNPSEQVQLEALKQTKDCIQFFKRAWRKQEVKKLTVSELEELLNCKLEIISEQERTTK